MSREMLLIKNFFAIRKRLGLARLGRKRKAAALPPASLKKKHQVTESTDFGFLLYELRPEKFDKVIVYLHGGGYVNPIAKQHWQLIEQLADQTSSLVLVPRYGLAPEHNVSEALEFLSRVIGHAKSFDAELILAGDSAGGGLAVAAIQQLGIQNQVSKLILISPWVDSDFQHIGMTEVEKHDPWLIPDNLRKIAAVWSGEDTHQDVKVSPLRGNFEGFPRTYLLIGQWDIFLFDCRLLRDKLLAQNVELDYEEIPEALHVYPLLPTPEGQSSRARIVEFIGR